MKKIVLSLLALAATMNIMAVSYSAIATIKLQEPVSHESCEMIIGQSDQLAPGLTNGEYAEINMEGRSVALYVEYNGVKYQHFASAPETMTNLTIGAMTNDKTSYNLIISDVVGSFTLKIGDANPFTVTEGTTVISLPASQSAAAIGVINPVTVAVSGSWAWDPWLDFVDNGDGTASVSKDLEAGNYQFGLHFGNIWSVNGYNYHRDYTSTANYKGGSSDNMSLTADVAGTYTFQWEYATRTFSIIFPAAAPDYGSYQRNVTVGNYGTICLPKAGTIAGATLFNIGSYENDMIYIDEVGSVEMEAGKPYIFEASADQIIVTYTSDVVVNEAGNANGLYGNYDLNDETAIFNVPEGDYILYNNLYWEVVSARPAKLYNYFAYIKIDQIINNAPAPGRRRVGMAVNNAQTTTGMDELNAVEAPVKKFIDGKMYIIRGEHMFDATGRMVK